VESDDKPTASATGHLRQYVVGLVGKHPDLIFDARLAGVGEHQRILLRLGRLEAFPPVGRLDLSCRRKEETLRPPEGARCHGHERAHFGREAKALTGISNDDHGTVGVVGEHPLLARLPQRTLGHAGLGGRLRWGGSVLQAEVGVDMGLDYEVGFVGLRARWSGFS
jgi:hypothetical protein